jgi:hypothetical protein
MTLYNLPSSLRNFFYIWVALVDVFQIRFQSLARRVLGPDAENDGQKVSPVWPLKRAMDGYGSIPNIPIWNIWNAA